MRAAHRDSAHGAIGDAGLKAGGTYSGTPRPRAACERSLLVAAATGGVVLRCRIGALALGKGLFRRARVDHHAEQPVVAFVAAAFVGHVSVIGVLAWFLNER